MGMNLYSETIIWLFSIMLYLFEDEDFAWMKEKTLYSRFEKEQISISEQNAGLKKVGRVLFLTNVDMPEQYVYELYKSHYIVEKFLLRLLTNW